MCLKRQMMWLQGKKEQTQPCKEKGPGNRADAIATKRRGWCRRRCPSHGSTKANMAPQQQQQPHPPRAAVPWRGRVAREEDLASATAGVTRRMQPFEMSTMPCNGEAATPASAYGASACGGPFVCASGRAWTGASKVRERVLLARALHSSQHN